MKKNAGMRAVGAQAVRELLGGKWMRLFTALTVCQFALAFAVRMMSGINPISFILHTMMEGFVAAEAVILCQRKESRNLRHLSVYCTVMAVLMLTVFLGLTVLAVAMATAKDSLPADLLEEWTRDYADNFPRMILSTALTGVMGAYYIFLRLTLRQGADILDRKRTDRDWRMHAVILTVAVAALSMTEEALSPFDIKSMGLEIVELLRYISLAILLWPGMENR